MAIVESGDRVRGDDAKHVLHSWSVRSAIDPIPIAGAEGRYFWDYDGKRYLDFASSVLTRLVSATAITSGTPSGLSQVAGQSRSRSRGRR